MGGGGGKGIARMMGCKKGVRCGVSVVVMGV